MTERRFFGGGGVVAPPEESGVSLGRVGPGSIESLIIPIRSIGSGYTAAAWGTANLARFTPFAVNAVQDVARLYLQTNTTANCDIGIYAPDGTRLVSSGSFAGGGDAYNVRDVADIELDPGLYYIGVACDSGGGQVGVYSLADASIARGFGMKQMASAFPLPSSATFANAAGGIVPVAGILGDTTS